MAGRALGTLFGQGDLGALAGEQLSKLFGYGDYRVAVKGNSLMSNTTGAAVPKFQGDGKRGVRLTEREFLGNITAGNVVSGSSVFTNANYPLNPLNSGTFPWLSKIAGLFDQWEPHGIVFEFHTTSSTFNGSSQALGAVIMATDYDVNDPLYLTKQQMENADYACSSVPSANLLHGIECDPAERPLEIMYTTPRANQLNFSTMGNFQIATQGCSVSNVVLGELWISYDITFYKKQLVSATADTGYLCSQGTVNTGDLLVYAVPQVNNLVTYQNFVGTGTDIILPPAQDSGQYLVTFYTSNAIAGISGLMQGPTLTNLTMTSGRSSVSTVGSAFLVEQVFKIVAPGAKLRYTLCPAGGPVTTSFTIQEVASNFLV